eukprot:gene11725-5064_t
MSRQLGYTEGIFNMILPYNGFTVVQCATVKGKITSETFKLAVASLQQKFKILQSGVATIDSVPHFKSIPNHENLFFEKNYQQKTNESKQEIFKKDIAEAFQSFLKAPEGFLTGLLWKVTLLNNDSTDEFDIILCCSHLICDGRSICTLMGELIKFIELINDRKEFKIKIVDIDPPIDELISKIDYKKKEINKKDKGEILFDDISMTKKAEQIFIFKQFQGENLVKLCKEKKITLNSLVYAAYFVGYVKSYCNCKDGQFFDISVPVCLRKKTNSSQNTLGLYLSQVDFAVQWKEEYTELKNDVIWKLASEINENIQIELKKDEWLARVHPNNIPPPESKVGRNMFPCLSNLGRVDGFFNLKYFEITGLYTSTACGMFGPVTMCHLATVNDIFYFTFTSVAPIHSKSRLDAISDETLKILSTFSN